MPDKKSKENSINDQRNIKDWCKNRLWCAEIVGFDNTEVPEADKDANTYCQGKIFGIQSEGFIWREEKMEQQHDY